MILSCIVCGAELDAAMPDPDYDDNQPYNGTCFMTQGHYGSTFFDPMDGTWLEINVCDDCLRKAQEKKQILYYINHRNKKFFEDGDA